MYSSAYLFWHWLLDGEKFEMSIENNEIKLIKSCLFFIQKTGRLDLSNKEKDILLLILYLSKDNDNILAGTTLDVLVDFIGKVDFPGAFPNKFEERVIYLTEGLNSLIKHSVIEIYLDESGKNMRFILTSKFEYFGNRSE